MNSPAIQPEAQLEELLSEPDDALVQWAASLQGDLIILGAGGKMGPSLARMAKRALDTAGRDTRVMAISRFSDRQVPDFLQSHGIETIACDLLTEETLDDLPDARNVIYMAGMKFGTQNAPELSWAMNCFLPARICRRFRQSRIVAFSTGNVYGLVPVDSAGSIESDTLRPVGEYAMSCLGRERMFAHFSQQLEIPTVLLRLNYAVEMRYGVLLDLAQKIAADESVDLAMGFVNVIWQGDANRLALRSLDLAARPAVALNLAGPEVLSIRRVCEQFGELLGKTPQFMGEEAKDALLSNSAQMRSLLKGELTGVEQIIQWTAEWVSRGGPTLNRPTHFENRAGSF